MKRNVGSIDRLVRIVLGLIIAIAGVAFGSWLGLLSIVLIATGLFNFCPLYAVLKLSTYKKES
jgi:hypothetical protein